VKQGDAQDGTVGDEIQRIDAIVEGIAALDTDEGGVLPGRARGAKLSRGSHVSDPRRILEEGTEALQVLLERTSAATRGSEGIGADDPGCSAEADLAGCWKVGMTEKAPPQEAAAVCPVEVVPKDAVPNERLDVEVDRIGASKELDSLLGDSELLGGVGDFHRNASLTWEASDRCDPGQLTGNCSWLHFVNLL